MRTKYGEIPEEMVKSYVHGMTGKVYKMIPMKEENLPLEKYIESTLREFVNVKEVVYYLRHDQNYLAIIGLVKGLIEQDDVDKFRSDAFKSMRLIARIKNSLEGDS